MQPLQEFEILVFQLGKLGVSLTVDWLMEACTQQLPAVNEAEIRELPWHNVEKET